LKALFYPDVPFAALRLPDILREVYTDGVYDGFLGNKKDLVIVELGANIGVVTARLQPHARKIYAVEPSPMEFEALSANRDYNGWGNVELFQLAIAGKDGEMNLSIGETNRTSSTLMLGEKINDRLFNDVSRKFSFHTVDKYEKSIRVQSKRIDTFFEENHIERVDFMKIDVEGAENLILRHAGFRDVVDRIGAIEIEYHFPDWEDLDGMLKFMGYTGARQKTEANVWLYKRD